MITAHMCNVQFLHIGVRICDMSLSRKYSTREQMHAIDKQSRQLFGIREGFTRKERAGKQEE